MRRYEQQEELLKASEVEVEERRKEQERLRAEIASKADQQFQIEEQFNSVEEEIAGKTKKMKKVFGMLMTARYVTTSFIVHVSARTHAHTHSHICVCVCVCVCVRERERERV